MIKEHAKNYRNKKYSQDISQSDDESDELYYENDHKDYEDIVKESKVYQSTDNAFWKGPDEVKEEKSRAKETPAPLNPYKARVNKSNLKPQTIKTSPKITKASPKI